jgi:type IV pilus assembly protein PilC
MSLLMGSGVPLLEAMEIVGQAMSSRMYRDVVLDSRDDVEKGVQLSNALAKYEIMPPILPEMIAVGEETGKMDEILLKLSEYYEKESEYAVKNLTTAMEPLIMIVLGVGVGLMVIAVIMPIYNLTSQF